MNSITTTIKTFFLNVNYMKPTTAQDNSLFRKEKHTII